MIFKIFMWLLMFFLIGALSLVPAYAEQSASQSASVTISSVNSVSVTYSENDYSGNIQLVNYSNKDVDVWVRSEVINTQTGENIQINGIKCWNHATDKNEELTNNYRKMGFLDKPKQGSISSLPTLDLELGSLSIIPDNCAMKIYITTVNPNLMIPEH